MGSLLRPHALCLLLVMLFGAFYSCADGYSFYSSGKPRNGQKLVIMPSTEEQSVFQGSSFFVSCSSEADNVQRLMWTNPDGNQITDYKGSVPYNKIPRIHVEDGRQGNKGVDLVMENIMRQDRGRYTCSANVDGTEESISFMLLVHKLIDFQNTPKVQYLEEGSDSELTCNVEGDPEPSVSWKAHGRKIHSADNRNEHHATSQDEKFQQGTRKNSLLVRNVTLEDRGTYVCSAVQLNNHISEFKNFNIDVKVHHKPLEDEDGMKEAYSFMQGRVNLTCGAVAEPQANFTWIKDDEIILPSDTVQIFNDEHQSVLQLTVNDQEQFGDYLCKAENKMGMMERVIVLTKGDKPPTPEFKVSRADVNELHLELHARDREMPILAYRVQYKESGNEWDEAPSVEFKKGDEYIINSLKQNTLYVLRAAAKNAAGYSDYTDLKMQRTAVARTASPMASSSMPSATPLLSLVLLVVVSFLALAANL